MSEAVSWDVRWIDSGESLPEVLELFKDEKYLSLDTETVGWETGNERLCLVQVGVPSKKLVVVIDPLGVGDLAPLAPILSEREPLIVAHNAAFEEKQFGRYGIKIRGVVDTLSLARKLRPDLPNHTLKTCCRYLLDKNISKEEQASDWSKRPLTKEQLNYAALDAEVTCGLYDVLAEMESKLELDPNLSVPDLMRMMAETVSARYTLMKEIAAEAAFCRAREEVLKDAIRGKLVDGAPSYEGEFGSCKVNRIKQTEVNPEKVRSVMPSIAEMVIAEHVDRKTLTALMKEHGIDQALLDQVLDITGYTDRLSLSIKDI